MPSIPITAFHLFVVHSSCTHYLPKTIRRLQWYRSLYLRHSTSSRFRPHLSAQGQCRRWSRKNRCGSQSRKAPQPLSLNKSVKRYLEVGTIGGYSANWTTIALPSNGQIVTLETNPRHAAVAQSNIATAGFSRLHRSKSRTRFKMSSCNGRRGSQRAI